MLMMSCFTAVQASTHTHTHTTARIHLMIVVVLFIVLFSLRVLRTLFVVFTPSAHTHTHHTHTHHTHILHHTHTHSIHAAPEYLGAIATLLNDTLTSDELNGVVNVMNNAGDGTQGDGMNMLWEQQVQFLNNKPVRRRCGPLCVQTIVMPVTCREPQLT